MTSPTPSQEYNLPVIGKIYCKLSGLTLNDQPLDTSEDSFEVLKIIGEGNQKIYLCNHWNSPGTPQLVPAAFVLRFEEL